MVESRPQAFRQLQEEMKALREHMKAIKHKIAVMSGKGGVGKSIVTASLASVFAEKGYGVGVLDADIHGPSIPKMMGVHGKSFKVSPEGEILPIETDDGVKIVSIDFLLDEAQPVVWRGPLKTAAIRQFLAEVAWGELDLLLIDLPPGTGDEALSILQYISDIDGVLLITIPSEVSQIVVKKAVTFARKLNAPILGIIENMSGLICPKCGARIEVFSEGGGEKIAKEFSLPFLGRIPLDPKISEAADAGKSFIRLYPDSEAAKSFIAIAEQLEARVLKA